MQDNEKRYSLELTKSQMWLVYRALEAYEDKNMDKAMEALKYRQSEVFDQWHKNVENARIIEDTIRTRIEENEEVKI